MLFVQLVDLCGISTKKNGAAPDGTIWRFAGTRNALYGGDGGIEE